MCVRCVGVLCGCVVWVCCVRVLCGCVVLCVRGWQNDPREPKRTLWVVHGSGPRPQFNEKSSPKREKMGGRGKKAKIWAVRRRAVRQRGVRRRAEGGLAEKGLAEGGSGGGGPADTHRRTKHTKHTHTRQNTQTHHHNTRKQHTQHTHTTHTLKKLSFVELGLSRNWPK